MHPSDYVEFTRELFESIQATFPDLESHFDPNVPLDLALKWLAQPGLAFPVSINLQGDELHLNAGEVLWVCWFPLQNPTVQSEFAAAVNGVLSGEYRIVEHYRGKRPVGAELQRREGGGWQTCQRYSRLHFPWPWQVTKRIRTSRDAA